MKKPLILTAVASLVIAPSAALAGPQMTENAAGQRQMVIEYKDLNLSNAAGIKRLEQRIDRAAELVCGMDRLPTGTRIVSTETRRCVSQAKAQAFKGFAAVIEQQRRGG